MAERLKFCADTVLLSYARIFFAENRLLGSIVLIATLNVPVVGFFGLLGGMISSACAALIGMDRDSVRKGVYGLNGILVGLGVGFYFEPTLVMLVVLMLVLILLTFVTITLNTLLYQQSGLPAMSMPFNLITWLVIGAGAVLGNLLPHGEHLHLLALPESLLPRWCGTFLAALGAVLFQPNQVTGLLLAVGLAVWSRIALLLMLAGFATSSALQIFLGINSGAVGGAALTFNHMFAALAIGGIFTVPGPGSLLLALSAAAASLFILTGISALFPPGMSPLALPFNSAVMVILYTLRSRLHPSFDLRLAPVPPGSPEENLSHYRENMRVWKRWGVALALPFNGGWTVSQGVDGAVTHQGDWRFAFDFQAVAGDGSVYRNSGLSCDDYFTWGASIHVPAAGTVHTVIDGVPDNDIGIINAGQNWGNCIIIAHAENYYSCLAHLQHSSITVKPGDLLVRGDQVALAGNSGRSPYPHLHFQMQMSPVPGAPGIPFSFENFTLLRGGQKRFVSKGDIAEGDVLCNAVPCVEYCNYFPFTMGNGLAFTVKKSGVEYHEMWEGGVDFYGNTYITSYPKETRLYFLLQDGVLSIKKLEGRRDSGLFFLGTMIAEVPFVEANDDVVWTSLEAADYALWPYITKLFDVFSLVGVSLRQKIDATLVTGPAGLHVRTISHVLLETPFGVIPVRHLPAGELLFTRDKGLLCAKTTEIELCQA